MEFAILLSCEHASQRVPARARAAFEQMDKVLESHRGWDIGALSVARELSKRLKAPLSEGRWSRLLIELNRSEHHPKLFSEITRNLPHAEKAYWIENYYRPYRSKVQESVRQLMSKHGSVLHLSIHSFTPVFEGQERPMDLGLLYSTKRRPEKEFCRQLADNLRRSSALRVRCNAPYRGDADGLTTWLRKQFDERYLGIEIEWNQKLFSSFKPASLAGSLADAVNGAGEVS